MMCQRAREFVPAFGLVVVLLTIFMVTTEPSFAYTTTSGLVTEPYAVFDAPQVPKPGYLQALVDPMFKTKVMRIVGNSGTEFTASNGNGMWGSDARQHYNDDQAWNADSTLLMLQNSGSPRQVILDGETYQPRHVQCSNYDNYDDRWHPSRQHPHERINVNGTRLEWFNVVTCTQTRVWTLPFVAQNDLASNPSSDGRFAALYDDTRIFVVDMDPQPPFASYASGNRRIGPVYDFSRCGLRDCSVGWASISPSGKFVVIAYKGDHPRIFDVDPDTLVITPHPMPANSPQCAGQDPAQGYIFDLGHQGLAYNPFDNNEEVMVGQYRSWCPSTVNGIALGSIVMVRLKDNLVTTLTRPGNEAHAYHISTQNTDRPGWVYASYWQGDEKRFNDEIIGVKMDGSQTVERLVHTHTDTSGCYRCEAHPVPSRDGLRVLFASAWNANCGSDCGSSSNPQVYVVDTRELRSGEPIPTSASSPTAPPTATALPSTWLPAIPAAVDARVEANAPTGNFGRSSSLTVDGEQGDQRESYLRFVVRGVGGRVQRALLRLYVTSDSTKDGPAVYVTSNGWSESELSWATRPARSQNVVANQGVLGTESWVEYDVTELVQGNGEYSFALVGETSDGVKFSAREGREPPQLLLQVTQ